MNRPAGRSTLPDGPRLVHARDVSSEVALAFVLLERAVNPDPAALMAAAAAVGLEVTLESTPGESDGPVSYAVKGVGNLLVMVIDAPHPDAATMASGLAAPEPDELARSTAHCIVTALGLPPDPRVRDSLLAMLTAAVIRSTPATAAMLGHGVSFHKASFFAEVADAGAKSMPLLICVDVTTAAEPGDRVSFLTHGLTRYGREEFYVTASQRGQGAMDFLLSMAGWMLDDADKELPTGDTVGRTAEEKITVQRVPSPLGDGPEVIRLDLDS